MWVHFPIVLLLGGLGAELLAALRPSGREALRAAAAWALWLGAASAWIAVELGRIAEDAAPHVPDAWQVLARHERLAYWTAGVFTALALWRIFLAPKARVLFIAAWLAACGLLVFTASQGGELVYHFGMGVVTD